MTSPSPGVTPVMSTARLVEIPDDESEASLMVLMRYMGCTPKAYGERPQRRRSGNNCGLYAPTGKEVFCDSDDDQDTLLTDDYEMESVNSLASLQNPSQSWTKKDISEALNDNRKSEKVIKVSDAMKLTKGINNANQASENKNSVVNLGSTAVTTKVACMKNRLNLTVDTRREKQTLKTNDSAGTTGSVATPAAVSPRSDAVAKAIAAGASHKHSDISPRSDATSPALAEAMAAVALFKKSSVDASSLMPASSIVSSELGTAPADADKAATVVGLSVTSPSKTIVKGKRKKTNTTSSVDNKIKSPAVASPLSTTDGLVETTTTSSVKEKKKKAIVSSDKKTKSISVVPPLSSSDAIDITAKSNAEGKMSSPAASVAGKKKKVTTSPLDNKIKSSSLANPLSTSVNNVESGVIKRKTKKSTEKSEKKIKSSSVATALSTSNAIDEATTQRSVEGNTKDDAPLDDKKSSSGASAKVDAGNAKSSMEGKKKNDTTTLEKKMESSSVATPSSTAGEIIETRESSGVEEKTKKSTDTLEKEAKSSVASPLSVDETNPNKKEKDDAPLGKEKSSSGASATSTSDADVAANSKSSTEGKEKKDTAPSDKKMKSSFVATLSSTTGEINEASKASGVKEKMKKGTEKLEKKIKCSSVATSSTSAPGGSTKKDEPGKSTQSKTRSSKKNTTDPVEKIEESSIERKNKGNDGKIKEKASFSKDAPLSPISPCTRSVREVDELLSQTRAWLARHSESHAKKQDSLASTSKEDGASSPMESSSSEHRTVAETLQEVTSPGISLSRPMSPPTLSELLHSKNGTSPASPSSPLFALTGSPSCQSTPSTGKSIKEQLEEIRAKQRKLEARQKAKLDQKA